MRRRDPKNELQADLYEWGGWIRTRHRIASEFASDHLPSILGGLQKPGEPYQTNTRMSATAAELNALVLGMWDDGGKPQRRAKALYYAYVEQRKFESAAIDMDLSKTGFQWLLDAAEGDLRHRRSLYRAAKAMLAGLEIEDGD